MIGEQRKSRYRFAIQQPRAHLHPVNRYQVNPPDQPKATGKRSRPPLAASHLLWVFFTLSSTRAARLRLIARAYRIPARD